MVLALELNFNVRSGFIFFKITLYNTLHWKVFFLCSHMIFLFIKQLDTALHSVYP